MLFRSDEAENEDGEDCDDDDDDYEPEVDDIASELGGDEFVRDNQRWDKDFVVGETFVGVKELRKRVKEYTIKVGFKCKRVKNEESRFTAFCMGEGCKWRIHASATEDKRTMMVKTYHGQHLCIKKVNNREADQNWLASKVIYCVSCIL